jgi:hypothetical protein
MEFNKVTIPMIIFGVLITILATLRMLGYKGVEVDEGEKTYLGKQT